MIPIGKHIQVSDLRPIRYEPIICEPEPIIAATVEGISPDITVPFSVGATVLMHRGREMVICGCTYVGIDLVVMWK